MNRIEEELDEIIGQVYADGFNKGQEAMIKVFADMEIISWKMADLFMKSLGQMIINEHYDREHEKGMIGAAIDALKRIK